MRHPSVNELQLPGMTGPRSSLSPPNAFKDLKIFQAVRIRTFTANIDINLSLRQHRMPRKISANFFQKCFGILNQPRFSSNARNHGEALFV